MSSSFTGNPNDSLPETFIIPEDEEQRNISLREYLNKISTSSNTKTSGIYDGTITITGDRFIPTFSTDTKSNVTYRSVFRKVVDFGALPNAAAKSVAHEIKTESTFSLTKLYGGATQPGASTWTQAIPIPHSSPILANNIAITVDATNVTITTGINRTAFTRCFVVIEWITTI